MAGWPFNGGAGTCASATDTAISCSATIVPRHDVKMRMDDSSAGLPARPAGEWLAALDDFRNWLIREAA
jgi:hypothetical protein